MAETESSPMPAAQLPAATTGLPRHLAAALAVFFPVLGGVAFLALEKKDSFVRFHAMQSIYLGGVLLAGALAFGFAELVFRQIPIIGWLIALGFAVVNLVFSVAWLVVWVVTIFKALTGAEWEIPVLGRLARQRLAGPAA